MIVTMLQAREAKSAAAHAEQMRGEISDRNAHSQLSSLSGVLSAAIRAMDKYGPGTGSTARRGCSPRSDAAHVRALTGEMKRLRKLLSERFGSEADDLINRINDLLVQFAEASSTADRDKFGCDIYNELVEFNGNIGNELDGNIFG
ncbi:hypothetical protein [Monaibacterium marinum]|nr:hypothetical protein [Monaibacterium marinum]